jgi:putative ABC transport system permease protein
MNTLWQDIRFAIRMMIKSPGFTAVAVLSLALGIGANTAIFSVTNAVLWTPMPYRNAERLMQVERVEEKTGAAEPWSYPKFEVLRDNNQVFESVAAYSNQNFALTETDDPQRVEVEMVSASYFPMLGVEAFRGRVFLPEEDQTPNTHPVALITHGIWQRRFGSDPNLLGQTISINKVRFEIVGILPEGFRGQSGTAEVWVPMMMAPQLTFPRRLQSKFAHWHQVIGRLKSDLSEVQAKAEMDTFGQKIDELIPWPANFGPSSPEKVRTLSLKESRNDPAIRRSLLVLFGAVGLVLAIACANIANLLLARSTVRRREIAVRTALGASRVRLIRQFLTESALLSFIGAVAGLIIAYWGIELLIAFKPTAAPGEITQSQFVTPALDFSPARIDGEVFAFTALLSLLTGIVFGLVPAIQASRPDINQSLKDSANARTALGSLRRLNPRTLFVVVQIALSLVLLIGAGLMIRSFERLQAIPAGFDGENLLTLQVDLPRYKPEEATAFFEQLIDRASQMPGVESVSVASATPLSSNRGATVIKIKGSQSQGKEPEGTIGVHSIGPDYFKAFRIPLIKGRVFTNQDREGSRRVAIINDAAARRFWPDQDPIGKEIWLGVGWESDDFAEIVGIVGDVKYKRIEEAVAPEAYVPYLQPTEPTSFVILRASSNPLSYAPALRQQIIALDRNAPVYDIKTMEERAASVTSRTRFSALLLSIFAGLAIVLSAAGIYGVTAYSVSGRTRELAIRMALGADRGSVMRLVIIDAGILIVVGLGMGIAGAFAATRLLASQLYEVGTTDPATFIVVSVIFAVIALLASFIPARNAMKVDPLVALRSE